MIDPPITIPQKKITKYKENKEVAPSLPRLTTITVWPGGHLPHPTYPTKMTSQLQIPKGTYVDSLTAFPANYQFLPIPIGNLPTNSSFYQ